MWPVITGLARACHPLPTAAVTSVATALGAAVGIGWPRLALLAAAVLCGQLSVGWLNDLVDRDRDRASGRTDKPVATGALSARALPAPIAVAAVACVVFSLMLGAVAGTAHLVAVAGAWAYNVRLKFTAWSWVPYAIGFGLVPVVVWLAAPAAELPPWWIVAAAALLGVGAHGANVLPDLADDRATGVIGLPHRLPARAARAGTAAVLIGAFALLVLGPSGRPSAWELAALVVATALAMIAGGALGRKLPARSPFTATVAVGGLAVVMLLARGAGG